MTLLSTFLVNLIPTLVLFDLDVSRSFVCTSFYRGFSIACGALDRLLKVSLAVGRTFSVFEVYCDYILEILDVGFSIDLIAIMMKDVCVNAGIDWLIDCERQLVMMCDYSRGVLTIYGEGTRVGSTFCSTAKARQCLQHGCMGYLAYVVDSWGEKKQFVTIFPTIREFLDVFPDELRGVPPERQVKFMIDLVSPRLRRCLISLHHER